MGWEFVFENEIRGKLLENQEIGWEAGGALEVCSRRKSQRGSIGEAKNRR